MEATELQLIKNCQAGELDSFGQLYDKYIKKIYNFIYYKTHHQQTAEDLTSEVFFKALRAINQFNSETGTFQAWLYQIARNSVIDHYRKSKFDLNIEDAWDIGSDEDYARDIDSQNLLEEVQKYMSKLSTEQRDILIMRLWDEMSYEEIARVTGKTETSCRMMFSRTIKKIRQEKMLMSVLLLLASIVK